MSLTDLVSLVLQPYKSHIFTGQYYGIKWADFVKKKSGKERRTVINLGTVQRVELFGTLLEKFITNLNSTDT